MLETLSINHWLPSSTWSLDSVTQTWLLARAIVASMILMRLTGMLLAMPMLAAGLPVRIRLILLATMTIVLMPGVSPPESLHGLTAADTPEILFGAVSEVVFGMVIGGVAQLLVTGISLAGELIAGVTGLQIAQTADPSTGQSVHQFSRLLGLTVTAVLFAAGGHRVLIDALLGSFHHHPPLSVAIDADLLHALIDHFAVGIESGVRVAAPVVACVLLTNLLVAIASRTVPQLNVFAVGINLNVLAALTVMALTIGSAGLVFETELAAAIDRMGLR